MSVLSLPKLDLRAWPSPFSVPLPSLSSLLFTGGGGASKGPRARRCDWASTGARSPPQLGCLHRRSVLSPRARRPPSLRWCAGSAAADEAAKSGGADGGSRKASAAEKHEFDDIQDLIVSAPPVSSGQSVAGQAPTLLEKEAKALEGAADFSALERTETMTGLLDLLEQSGVTPGYAFEFVRHAGDLIDDLFVEAKERMPRDRAQNFEAFDGKSLPISLAPKGEDPRSRDVWREAKTGDTAEITVESENSSPWQSKSLASGASECAAGRELGRLVSYFQTIGMKAQSIPRLLPFLDRGGEIDRVMAKVEVLRSLGVKHNHLPCILADWPRLLSLPRDRLARAVDYLVGLGLRLEEVGKMVTKYPQILGRGVEGELRESVEALEDLGVLEKDVRRLVARCPVLLTSEAKDKLDPLVAYLESEGVERRHIGVLLLRKPMLLDCDVETDLAPVGTYLKSLNASPSDMDKILVSFPQMFGYDVEQDLRPMVRHLESLGVESHLMGKVLRRHPRLLRGRHSFKVKLEFLLNLGLDPKDLGKIIFNAPQLLCLSVVDNMEPTTEFLISMGIKGPLLLKVLKLKPMVLAYNVQKKLKRNFKFLKSLEIKEEEIAKLVARHPQLLTLSVEKNLRPTVAYLLKLGFTRDEVTGMVKKLPSLLGLNVVSVLAPKYGYLVDVMHRPRAEVVRFPHYFSYSLAKRIVPRHIFLGSLAGSLSLSSLYGCSDAVFDKRARKKLPQTQQLS